jgi:hypothetical protein
MREKDNATRTAAVAVAILFCTLRAYAQSTETRVLFPVYSATTVRGALDWTYATKLAGTARDQPALVWTSERSETILLDRDTTKELFLNGSKNGRFLHVLSASDSPASWNFQLLSSSPSGRRATTRLPVVPASRFVRGRTSFLDVSSIFQHPATRATLRLYLLGPTATTAFLISLQGNPQLGPAPTAGTIYVTAFTRDGNDDSFPLYASISLPGSLRVVCQPAPRSGPCVNGLRIDIQPSDPTEPYWPLLSIVDDANEEVKVYWPD